MSKFARNASLFAIVLLICACQSRVLNQSQRLATVASQATQRSDSSFSVRFVEQKQIDSGMLLRYQQNAQVYSDSISKRRNIDLFQLHPEVLGLNLSFQNAKGIEEEASLISFLGTAKTRNDLNVELRVLAGQQLGMNLNYSGPVTRGRTETIDTHVESLESNKTKLRFELITGLPGEQVTSAYGDYLTATANYLRYRFQSKPMVFDDGPLIYAIQNTSEELLGFAFFNTRNLLILGDRKYADVQSVAVFDPQGNNKGAYTLIAFNPKTEGSQHKLTYTLETSEQLSGQLAILGNY